MFMLYAVLFGFLGGLLLGGRPAGLGELRFHWPWLALGGLIVQIALFSGPVADRVGDLGPVIYVASTSAVLVAVLRNVRIKGLALVALGAVSNLTAIVANGGYMPVSPSALEALGRASASGYSNSIAAADPAIAPLTDIFAMPRALPFANVFSIGDVLIGVGVGIVIIAAMRAVAGPVRGGNSPE